MRVEERDGVGWRLVGCPCLFSVQSPPCSCSHRVYVVNAVSSGLVGQSMVIVMTQGGVEMDQAR